MLISNIDMSVCQLWRQESPPRLVASVVTETWQTITRTWKNAREHKYPPHSIFPFTDNQSIREGCPPPLCCIHLTYSCRRNVLEAKVPEEIFQDASISTAGHCHSEMHQMLLV